ncbi:hypothetical protein RCH23_001172 [Cryobacterium sp. CAN_C3]|uniref:hypothetical protein n=1 Tax=unclassified Cryobacterium TaxID=2649013 RepID=UPI0018C95E42|nr:hypothetical protein [Cryobacterium sp. CAN_C3]MEC5153803.1 hypothetical protein [Cryobacterium sp. CAN_C3]
MTRPIPGPLTTQIRVGSKPASAVGGVCHEATLCDHVAPTGAALAQDRAGKTLIFDNSYLPHLSALVTFPVAVAGLISGLTLARPLLRVGAGRPHLRTKHQGEER